MQTTRKRGKNKFASAHRYRERERERTYTNEGIAKQRRGDEWYEGKRDESRRLFARGETGVKSNPNIENVPIDIYTSSMKKRGFPAKPLKDRRLFEKSKSTGYPTPTQICIFNQPVVL